MGVFATALASAARDGNLPERGVRSHSRGLVGLFLDWLRRARRDEARLVVRERITIAPRQTVALIEVDGERLLLAASVEGAPTFYPLDGPKPARTRTRRSRRSPEDQRV